MYVSAQDAHFCVIYPCGVFVHCGKVYCDWWNKKLKGQKQGGRYRQDFGERKEVEEESWPSGDLRQRKQDGQYLTEPRLIEMG